MKVWTYWEDTPGVPRYPYLNICRETHLRNAGNADVTLVGPEEVEKLLPGTNSGLGGLKTSMKVDVVRVRLLEKYGGLWMDFDTILFKDPTPLGEPLEHFDFITMGMTEGSPDNWFMGSVPSGDLISEWADAQEKILKDEKTNLKGLANSFKMGRDILRPLLKVHKSHQWPGVCSSCDSEGDEITNVRIESREPIDEDCRERRILLHLRNGLPGYTSRLRKKSKEKILDSDTLMGNLLRDALGMEPLREPEPASRGLGDTIKKITGRMKIKQCGGCGRRQEILNRLFPYEKGSIKTP